MPDYQEMYLTLFRAAEQAVNKVKREVLKLAQLMLGLFCCSKTISYQ